jgi:hypothetical protein
MKLVWKHLRRTQCKIRFFSFPSQAIKILLPLTPTPKNSAIKGFTIDAIIRLPSHTKVFTTRLKFNAMICVLDRKISIKLDKNLCEYVK